MRDRTRIAVLIIVGLLSIGALAYGSNPGRFGARLEFGTKPRLLFFHAQW